MPTNNSYTKEFVFHKENAQLTRTRGHTKREIESRTNAIKTPKTFALSETFRPAFCIYVYFGGNFKLVGTLKVDFRNVDICALKPITEQTCLHL